MKPSQSQKENAFASGAALRLGDPLLLYLRQLIEQTLAAWFSDASRLAELSLRLQRHGPATRPALEDELAGLVRALELIEQRTTRLEQGLHALGQELLRLAQSQLGSPSRHPPAPRCRPRRKPCSPK